MATTISVRFQMKVISVSVLTLALLLGSSPVTGAEDAMQATKKATASAAAGGDRLQRRIDFGNSYILGQSIKSGAVYLLHRKKSEIKSMLHYREDYREEILEGFSVEADSALGLNQGAGVATETLDSMNKKTVLK
jgi:hypothetical protein